MKYDTASFLLWAGINGAVALFAADAGHSYIAALCGFGSGNCLTLAIALLGRKPQ